MSYTMVDLLTIQIKITQKVLEDYSQLILTSKTFSKSTHIIIIELVNYQDSSLQADIPEINWNQIENSTETQGLFGSLDARPIPFATQRFDTMTNICHFHVITVIHKQESKMTKSQVGHDPERQWAVSDYVVLEINRLQSGKKTIPLQCLNRLQPALYTAVSRMYALMHSSCNNNNRNSNLIPP